MSLTIDSVIYDLPIKVLNRKAEILFKFAERTEAGILKSEAIGTFYNYELEIGMSANNITDYAALWLAVTEPTGEHEIVILGDTFNCYFSNISDEVMKDTGTPYYKNMRFSVIATSPARTP